MLLIGGVIRCNMQQFSHARPSVDDSHPIAGSRASLLCHATARSDISKKILSWRDSVACVRSERSYDSLYVWASQ